MRGRLRFFVFSMTALGLVVVATACNAILGITALDDPGNSDSGVADSAMADDSFVASDAASDAMKPCTTGAHPDPCVIVEPQTDGSIFPTWSITYDENESQGTGIVPPNPPSYVDAGLGAVTETHTNLTWQTAYRDAGTENNAIDFEGAVKACQALPGGGWRLPTRIELASTQYRFSETRTSCIPPVFDQNQVVAAWSSTSAPVAVGTPTSVYVADENGCGFLVRDRSQNDWVRCVKGDTKPATFIVSDSKGTVHAVDTGLVWERTGILVKDYQQAKDHCDTWGGRIPGIQELYSIIDTRTVALFQADMFVPPVTDGGAAKDILSQTVFFRDPDGGAVLNYHTVSIQNSPWGAENAAAPVGEKTDKLLRCVKDFVP